MSIQAVIFDMYETLVTQFCSPLYYGTQIAEDLGLRTEEFLPGWRAAEEARATGKLTFEDTMEQLIKAHGVYSPSSATPRKCWTGSPNNTVKRDIILQTLPEGERVQ